MLRQAAQLLALFTLFVLSTSPSTAGEWGKDSKTGCVVWHGNPKPPVKLTLTWSGACRNGKGHGTGTLVIRSSGKTIARYAGPLVGGKPHGHGRFSKPNGDRYVGDFRHGRFEGRGKLKTGNGDTYVGEFSKGTMHGRGVMTLSNGQKFEGRFQNGMPAGQ